MHIFTVFNLVPFLYAICVCLTNELLKINTSEQFELAIFILCIEVNTEVYFVLRKGRAKSSTWESHIISN